MMFTRTGLKCFITYCKFRLFRITSKHISQFDYCQKSKTLRFMSSAHLKLFPSKSSGKFDKLNCKIDICWQRTKIQIHNQVS